MVAAGTDWAHAPDSVVARVADVGAMAADVHGPHLEAVAAVQAMAATALSTVVCVYATAKQNTM